MGSKAGWIIGGVLAATVAAIFLVVVVFPPHSGATSRTLRAGVLDLVPMDVDPAGIVGWKLDGRDDAAAHYKRAFDRLAGMRAMLDRLIPQWDGLEDGSISLSQADAESLAAFAADIHAGAQQASMNYMAQYDSKVEVALPPATADQMQVALDGLVLLGLARTGGKDYPAAEQAYCDALVMGRHFVQERGRVATVQRGLGLQSEACRRLGKLYTKHWTERVHRVPALNAYLSAVGKVSAAYGEKLTVLKKLKWIKEGPGDVFNIAENDPDRAWRVEAIATLGIIRFNAGRGENATPEKLIRRYAADGDALEASAAKFAAELTIEQIERLGAKWRNRIADCGFQTMNIANLHARDVECPEDQQSSNRPSP